MIASSARATVSQGLRLSGSRRLRLPVSVFKPWAPIGGVVGARLVSTSTSDSPEQSVSSDSGSYVPSMQSSFGEPGDVAEGLARLDRAQLETLQDAVAWQSDNFILGNVQGIMEAVHSATGLPWWATIIMTTLVVRTSLVPFTVIQARHGEKLAIASPEMDAFGRLAMQKHEELNIDPKRKLRDLYTSSKGRELRDMAIHWWRGSFAIAGLYGARPLGLVIAPLVHLPVWISFVLATRDLLLRESTGITTEGALWFSNLAESDTSGALPMLAIACTYGVTEYAITHHTKFFKIPGNNFRHLVQSIVLLTAPIAVFLPQGVFMYWIPSSLFGAMQIAALRNNHCRERLGLRPYSGLPTEPVEAVPAGDEVKKQSTVGANTGSQDDAAATSNANGKAGKSSDTAASEKAGGQTLGQQMLGKAIHGKVKKSSLQQKRSKGREARRRR